MRLETLFFDVCMVASQIVIRHNLHKERPTLEVNVSEPNLHCCLSMKEIEDYCTWISKVEVQGTKPFFDGPIFRLEFLGPRFGLTANEQEQALNLSTGE
jgi:hypothetical protein